MATSIIDALVTLVTLDASGYHKGVRDVLDAQGTVREKSKSMGDAVDASNKRMAQSFTTVRNELLGFVLALAGAKGIKDFVGSIISGDAATGRLAANLGVATEQLSAWEGAIGRVGGNAKSADAALQAMVSTVQEFKLTGQAAHAGDLMGLGVNRFDDPTQMLLQIADASQRMSRPEFAARAGRLGFDQDTINLLARGREGVSALLEEQKRLGVTTDADAKAAQEFQASLSKLETAIKGAMRPAIEGLTGDFNDLANDKGGLEDFFSGVAAAAHRVTIGFRLAKAGLADFVTIVHQLRAGDFAGALNTFMHGSVEKVNDTPAAPDTRSVENIRGAGFPGYQGGEHWRGAAATGSAEAYLQSKGLTAAQAKGAVGVLFAESGLDPESRTNAGAHPNTPYGTAGLAQWRGSRQNELFRRYGRHPTRNQQLDFFIDEMKSGSAGGWAALQAAQTPMQAGLGLIDNNLKPGAGRNADARGLVRYLGNPAVMASGGNSSTSSVSIGHMTVVTPDAKSFARQDLSDALRDRGVIVQASRGVTP